jgi:molybdopterin/thiamine biosynthesis adenylyltransferase
VRLPIGDQVRQPMHPADVGETYHRQVLAIGEEGQAKVQGTQVAIVGLGGVGSVVAQQLAHLGVSQFVLVDDDRVERTNLHRLVGSIPSDVGAHKVDVANRQIKAINRRVQVTRLPSSVRTQEALDAIKGVDVLFGCVDTDGARLVLNELALAYLVPYIDCGVGIIAGTEGLEEAGGKVSVWTPGRPCLLCTRDINPRVAAEELENREEREFRQQHGYVAGAQVPGPAVISLNSTIASVAVTEFLALVAEVRPSRHYTYYDLLEGRMGLRLCSRNSRCTACGLYGLGDRADVVRYSRLGLPADLPTLAER